MLEEHLKKLKEAVARSSREFKYSSPFSFRFPNVLGNQTGGRIEDANEGSSSESAVQQVEAADLNPRTLAATPAEEDRGAEDQTVDREDVGQTRETPFEHGIVTFQNENLKIYVFRKAFERQKRFALDDHLFLLKIEVLRGKPPVLLDIEDILEKAFKHVVELLKAFYNPGKQYFVQKRIRMLLFLARQQVTINTC